MGVSFVNVRGFRRSAPDWTEEFHAQSAQLKPIRGGLGWARSKGLSIAMPVRSALFASGVAPFPDVRPPTVPVGTAMP